MFIKKMSLVQTSLILLGMTTPNSLIFAANKSKPQKSLDELYQLIQQQQHEIETLKQQLNQTQKSVEATGEAVERVTVANQPPKPDADSAASQKTHIGGYGELHYNRLDSKDEVDFHRFVLFFSHQFNSDTRFISEFELEHVLAGEGKSGEAELEQAYVEFDLVDSHTLKAGLFLIPVGIINETHEPPTFYGVERNTVENNIIPSTWWEAGLGLAGQLQAGFSYDIAFTSGLDVPQDGNNAFKIRNGRKKVSNAPANAGALTGRIKWTGMPGFEWGLTAQYQDDITQGKLGISATLLESHIVFTQGALGLRALYAQWNLDGSQPAALGRDKQLGWYIEPSYKINAKWGLFARYETYDNSANSHSETEVAQTSVGFNFWPHEQVVFKLDYMDQSQAGHDKGFNLGVGYQF